MSDEVTITPEQLEAAIEDATNFFKCNGVVTYDQWQATDTTSKAILVQGAERWHAERVLMELAAQTPDGMLEVSRAIDGGDRLIRTKMTRAVSLALKVIGKKPVER